LSKILLVCCATETFLFLQKSNVKRDEEEENLIKLSFSKRERREISFSSDLFSVIIPEKKTSTK